MVSIVVTPAFCDGYKCGVAEKQTGIICRCPDNFINSEIDAWLRGHQEALYATKGIQASNGTPQGMDFSSAFKLIRGTDGKKCMFSPSTLSVLVWQDGPFQYFMIAHADKHGWFQCGTITVPELLADNWQILDTPSGWENCPIGRMMKIKEEDGHG